MAGRRRGVRRGVSGWPAALGVGLALAAFAAAPGEDPLPRAEDCRGRRAPDGLPVRLVLALDGIPYDSFAALQGRGHFAQFFPASRLVSTFPSLSDVAFATIAGSDPPEGYQVMRFDPDRNEVVGTTLRALSSEAHQHLPADTRPRSSVHRMVTYVAAYRMALRELDELRQDFLASSTAVFIAYIEATDPLLHVQGREGAERFLLQLEALLAQLEEEVLRRTGRELRVDIVSDHGSSRTQGRMLRLERALERCGYDRARRLDDPGDVGYSQAGIISVAALYCEPQRAEPIARCLAQVPGVDLVSFARGDAVVVVGRGGEAEIRPDGPARADLQAERYRYRPLRGDPLELAELFGAPNAGELVLDQATVFERTKDRTYPDPLRRLWHAFHGLVREPATVLVSLEDGYEFGDMGVRLLARLRGRRGTHGSLARDASLGVLASNWRPLPDAGAWEARELLFGECAE